MALTLICFTSKALLVRHVPAYPGSMVLIFNRFASTELLVRHVPAYLGSMALIFICSCGRSRGSISLVQALRWSSTSNDCNMFLYGFHCSCGSSRANISLIQAVKWTQASKEEPYKQMGYGMGNGNIISNICPAALWAWKRAFDFPTTILFL